MNQAELADRNEMDRDILYYVREMQARAPVTVESIRAFLAGPRRRQVTARDVQDRLDYLVSADVGLLARISEWTCGPLTHFRITGKGMDLLDGAIPPAGWQRHVER